MAEVYKNKMPLKQGDYYFYPLTTYDQVQLPEGITWEGIFAGGGGSSAVLSVNGQTGVVTLVAKDVSARPDTWVPTIDEIDGLRAALDAAQSSGGVKTVNGVSPDVNGNITLENTSPTFDTLTVNTLHADKIVGAVYE